MATCKDCFHYEACSGFKPTDLDKDVWHYCKMGIPEEIPDIDQRCDSFKDSKSWAEVVRCKDCKFGEMCSIREAMALTDPNGHCCRGERRTDGAQG